VVARTEIENGGIVRIDGKPFTQSPSGFVPAHPEIDRDDLPCGPAVTAPEDRGFVPVIGARSRINDVWIDGVGRDAFDAEVISFRHAVFKRDPSGERRIPAVSAPDIGADVGEAFLGAAEDKARNKSTAADSH